MAEMAMMREIKEADRGPERARTVELRGVRALQPGDAKPGCSAAGRVDGLTRWAVSQPGRRPSAHATAYQIVAAAPRLHPRSAAIAASKLAASSKPASTTVARAPLMTPIKFST